MAAQGSVLNTEQPGLVEDISPMAGRLELGGLETKPLCGSVTSSSVIAPQDKCAPPGPQSPVWEGGFAHSLPWSSEAVDGQDSFL